MKKYLASGIIAIIALSITSVATYARQKTEAKYPLILSFHSIGTGVPNDQPLKDYITTYRRKNKLPALRATLVGGLGREGEYAILFPLKELTAMQKKRFVAALAKDLPALNKKSENGGGINLSQNQPFDTSQGRIEPQTVDF